MELWIDLFTIIVIVGGRARSDGADQLNPTPPSSNGCCISTKNSGVKSIPFEPRLGGIFWSTSTTNQFVSSFPEFTLEDDCTSILFKPPKLGITEFATGIIISWPGIIPDTGGVATT